MIDLTKKQANALERLTMGDKIPRKLKKQLKKEAEGYVPKKRPKTSASQRVKQRENEREKKVQVRRNRETKMVEHLVKSGWKRSGPNMDVWSISSWKDGYDTDCYKTLCKAYKIQLKLESEGYERPVGIDDAIEL